jgi:isoaspartyl peptidase/L-asparaginase-like protein (Ntn-hydrolase superfamily)
VNLLQASASSSSFFAINTWSGDFSGATLTAHNTLASGGSALDGIESGCHYCEEHQCDTTVGFGNHPDTHGETSLDAMIMDGDTYDMGAVGYIRKYRDAIALARAVMWYTGHTFLVGDGAERFASEMGFTEHSATTENSKKIHETWKWQDHCQPNFYENIPEAKEKCGPYNVTLGASNKEKTSSLRIIKPLSSSQPHRDKLWQANKENHDTIGMITRDTSGKMACGTSTNGANHKVAGRIGDSPIPGAGCYVNSQVGGATATGDGDVMMRFLPSFYAVSLMEAGFSPKEACRQALGKITKVFPTFSGGLVCITTEGEHAGATNNMNFTYSLMKEGMNEVQVIEVA